MTDTPKPEAGADLARDIAWLNSLREAGHTGESTTDRIARERAGERIDRLIAALSPALEGRNLEADWNRIKSKISQSIPNTVRLVYTGPGVTVKSVMAPDTDDWMPERPVYAIIGPFDSHTGQPELQKRLLQLGRQWNAEACGVAVKYSPPPQPAKVVLERDAILRRINDLGGYNAIFNAISGAVKIWPSKESATGISISVIDFVAGLPDVSGGKS